MVRVVGGHFKHQPLHPSLFRQFHHRQKGDSVQRVGRDLPVGEKHAESLRLVEQTLGVVVHMGVCMAERYGFFVHTERSAGDSRIDSGFGWAITKKGASSRNRNDFIVSASLSLL